ncbi:hypothetical protein SAMN05192550_1834 [Flavobacterium glycines]|uniref:Uncharacterized protein n=2 Tax=Flavobacterium glycines TaxID=551990 RepID=A0A1G8SJE2_9FLAO|nr:hypothetical protein [Flavobacterium glycines]SDJ29372.1 hypothetical protein SAMN05192550_1834 [Flavobacterium glycines]
MKKILNRILGYGALLMLINACSNDEVKYDTAVVKDFQIQLNGEPWSLNTGISTKPIFIYKNDGEFFANYSSHYRFALDNGAYKFIATDIPEQMVPSPVNLNDLIIPQAVNADQPVKISAAMPYVSPFKDTLTMNILTRSGILRLKAMDKTADPAYTYIKTIVKVKRNGYKVADETFVQQDMEVSRTKKTTTGGINYTDDFILFQTDEAANKVSIRIQFLKDNMEVVSTKEISGSFPILANGVTQINLNLNDPDTPVIQNYVATVNGEAYTAKKINQKQ